MLLESSRSAVGEDPSPLVKLWSVTIYWALVVNATAQQMAAAGSNLAWSVAGTGLIVGQRLVFELTMLVTSASGANTGKINKFEYSA